jgi:hypothetical protein
MLETQAQELKPMLKELLHELLMEEGGLLKELIYEVIEDVALAKTITEGKNGENVKRDEIFALLDE